MRATAFTAAGLLVLASAFAADEAQIKTHADNLRSPDVRVRIRAATALWQEGANAKSALTALTTAVEDLNLNVRYFAASTLKKLGPDAASAVPALMRALKTVPGGTPKLEGPERYYADTRAVAAEALGAIGEAAHDAISSLKEALKDEDPSVREAAAEALKKVDVKK